MSDLVWPDSKVVARLQGEIATLHACLAECLEAITPADAILLADWIDVKYPNDPNPEIQRDLRKLAAALTRAGELIGNNQ